MLSASSQRTVILIELSDCLIGKSQPAQKFFIIIRFIKKIHRKNYGIFIGLRFSFVDFTVTADLIKADKFESEFLVCRFLQELPVLFAEEFNEKGFSVSGFAD